MFSYKIRLSYAIFTVSGIFMCIMWSCIWTPNIGRLIHVMIWFYQVQRNKAPYARMHLGEAPRGSLFVSTYINLLLFLLLCLGINCIILYERHWLTPKKKSVHGDFFSVKLKKPSTDSVLQELIYIFIAPPLPLSAPCLTPWSARVSRRDIRETERV